MLTKKTFLCLTLLLSFIICDLNASPLCVLKLKRRHKTLTTYFKNSGIIFLSDNSWVTGIIDSIGDNFIIVRAIKFPISDIQCIKDNRKEDLNVGTAGAMLMLGGVFFLGLNVINDAIAGEDITISQNTAIVSPSLFVVGLTGVVAELMKRHGYNLRKKYSLHTICF